jgi:galactose-1-phosphate uridylyltransferase
MLLLDKWTLTGTLTLLSHPERFRTAVIKKTNHSNQTLQQEEQRRVYAEAYQELMDEISDVRDGSTNSVHFIHENTKNNA